MEKKGAQGEEKIRANTFVSIAVSWETRGE
jgi:hypothetical protein